MKFSYNFAITPTMYNRKYAKNKITADTLSIQIDLESDEPVHGGSLQNIAEEVREALHGATIVHVNDPIMVDLLEPKSGNTVHNRLNELKATVLELPVFLGLTTPPETKNGLRLVVFPSVDDVTLEGLAHWIKRSYSNLSAVSITDGSLIVEV